MTYTLFRHLLSRFLNWMESILVLFEIVLLGVVVLANACEVFLRTFGFRSLYWILEFTVVSGIYIVFLGAPVLFKRKGDIVVSFIYDRLPRSFQPILSVIVDLLIVFFLAVGIKASCTYISSFRGGYTQTMKLPIIFVYSPILLAFILIFIVVLDWLLSDIEQLCLSQGGNKIQIPKEGLPL